METVAAQRRSRRSRSTSSSGPRDLTARSQALAELQEALGLRRRAAAHRVLRHQPPAGHQRRRQHGRLRGRAGPQERVPPVRDPGNSTARTTAATPTGSPRWSGAGSAATSTSRSPTGEPDADDPATTDARAAGPAGHRPDHRPAAQVRLPAEPVVVDGGAAAGRRRRRRRCDELGIDDVALVGLAKRLEEVWLPGRADPVILPRTTEALTCCSGSATRRTGSPSPTTGRSGRRR